MLRPAGRQHLQPPARFEAEPLLLSGYEGMSRRSDRIPAASRVRLKEALERLVKLFEITGRPEQADARRTEIGRLLTKPR